MGHAKYTMVGLLMLAGCVDDTYVVISRERYARPDQPEAGEGVAAAEAGDDGDEDLTAGPEATGAGGTAAARMDSSAQPERIAPSGRVEPLDVEVLFQLQDPQRNDVEPGEVCTRLAELRCAGEAHCCADSQRDYASCIEVTGMDCREQLHFDSLSITSVTGFSVDHARRALAIYEEFALDCDPGLMNWAESLQGFRGVFTGTREMGEACDPVTFSVVDGGAALVSCANPGVSSCIPDSTLLSWTCRPRSESGGPCLTDFNCVEGEFCVQEDYTFPGYSSCAARKESGAACIANNECESLSCRKGSCGEVTVAAAYCPL